MGVRKAKPTGVAANARRRRRNRAASILAALCLAVVGAAFDPAIIKPFGPLAAPPERVGATFTRCGRGAPGFACVIDGDTIRLGEERVRITGIDAPEIDHPQCAAEERLAERAADRLTQLLDEGPFEMVAHRFNMIDRYGRDLRVLRRDERVIGDELIREGLAHRYYGMKTGWCG